MSLYACQALVSSQMLASYFRKPWRRLTENDNSQCLWSQTLTNVVLKCKFFKFVSHNTGRHGGFSNHCIGQLKNESVVARAARKIFTCRCWAFNSNLELAVLSISYHLHVWVQIQAYRCKHAKTILSLKMSLHQDEMTRALFCFISVFLF